MSKVIEKFRTLQTTFFIVKWNVKHGLVSHMEEATIYVKMYVIKFKYDTRNFSY